MADRRSPVAKQETESLVGTLVDGKWRVAQRVGAGELAVVYRAVAPDGTPVALHVLHPHLAQDAELAAGYARAAREPWGHEDSVQILASGKTDDGAPYVIGELMDGERVSRLVARRRRGVSPTEALRIVRDALVVLASAHESGVVHGDLAPSRLFVCEDGTVKVMGFWLALVRQRAAELGAAPTLDVAFSAPEVLGGEPPSKLADLWSMAAILLYLLTGELPYDGTTDAEMRASAEAKAPRSLAAIAPGAPELLLRLVERGLAVDPDLRFPTAHDMRSATEQALLAPQLATARSLHDLESVPPASGPISRRSPEAPVQVESKRDGVVVKPAHSQIPGPRRAARGTADTLPAMEAQRFQPKRPRADDIEDQIDGLRAMFQTLETAVAARRHTAPGHPGAERALARALEQAQALHATTNEPVGWSVTQRTFVLGGKNVWQPEGELGRVPSELFAAGVRRLELKPGIDAEELARLVEALQPGATDAGTTGGDLATLIRVEAFPHLVAHLADAFGSRFPRRRNT